MSLILININYYINASTNGLNQKQRGTMSHLLKF